MLSTILLVVLVCGAVGELVVVSQEESQYGRVTVAAVNDTVLVMLLDKTMIGARFLHSPDIAFAGMVVMSAPCWLPRGGGKVLQLGIGGGAVPNALAGCGYSVHSVDINPVVANAALHHFGLQGRTTIADALTLLASPPTERYSYIVHDLFSGSAPHPKLVSVSLLETIRDDWLEPGGMLILNTVGFIDGDWGRITRAVWNSLSLVFDEVACYRDVPTATPGPSNIICFAMSAPPPPPHRTLHNLLDYHEDGEEGTEAWYRSHFTEWLVYDRRFDSTCSLSPEDDTLSSLTPAYLASADVAIRQAMLSFTEMYIPKAWWGSL